MPYLYLKKIDENLSLALGLPHELIQNHLNVPFRLKNKHLCAKPGLSQVSSLTPNVNKVSLLLRTTGQDIYYVL